MRIISGFLKGKKINFLKSITTRPIRDFVKENIFNILVHSRFVNFFVEDSNVLDLYSGVGSFGIECISRGAKKVTFVEDSSEALTVLKKNIKYLKIENRIKIFESKITSFFNRLNEKDKYEIIFMDPPFSENFFINDLKKINNLNICKKNHLIIIHRESKSNDNLLGVVDIITTKRYGRSKLIFANLPKILPS